MKIRLRLALVYAAILVGMCAMLLAVNYAMLYDSLYHDIHDPGLAAFQQAADDGVPFNYEKLSAYQRDQAEVARQRDSTLLKTAATSAAGLAVIAVLGFWISWLVAGRVLRPLRTLTTTTRRISHEHLDERVAMAGPQDEIRELADTFDAMVARLEAAFAGQRRFVADASHELRTPLSIVRTGAEVLLAKKDSTIGQWEAMAQRSLIATSRAERLLDALLALARSDSGALSCEPTDLAVAAAKAVSDADNDAEDSGLDVRTDLRPVAVQGDPVLLDHLVRNLTDNAIRHNRRGGWVDVTTGTDNGRAVIRIGNSGPAIPDSDVDRLFEPFQRLAPGRTTATSSGLGLAIVRSIVRAHDGTVHAAPNPGGGLTVTVTLPAAVTPIGSAP